MRTTLCFFIFLVISFTNCQGDSCCKDNTIQVSGQGKSTAIPDMAVVQIRFNQKGKTSADAVKALSAKVNQALAILKANGYSSDSYETGSISVYPQYSYINGRSEIIGQQASQSLTIRARGVDSKGQKVGVLVDALAAVNGINIDSVSFDVYNKIKLQAQARADAFKDAKQKAEDYASFAGLSLGRILSIDDSQYVEAPANRFGGAADAPVAAMSVKSFTTSVPLGDIDVSYRTTLTYSLR